MRVFFDMTFSKTQKKKVFEKHLVKKKEIMTQEKCEKRKGRKKMMQKIKNQS